MPDYALVVPEYLEDESTRKRCIHVEGSNIQSNLQETTHHSFHSRHASLGNLKIECGRSRVHGAAALTAHQVCGPRLISSHHHSFHVSLVANGSSGSSFSSHALLSSLHTPIIHPWHGVNNRTVNSELRPGLTSRLFRLRRGSRTADSSAHRVKHTPGLQ